MWDFRTIRNIAVLAAVPLLCVLAPPYATTANLQKDTTAVGLQKGMGEASLWGQLLRHASDLTLSKFKGVVIGARQLPPWGEIFTYEDKLSKVTNEDLNAAARKFHIQEKIDDFRNTFRDIISTSAETREHTTGLTQKSLTLDQISDELGVVFNDILDHLKDAFPPPDQAPNHEEWQERVHSILEEVWGRLLGSAREYGMSEDGEKNLRRSFDRLKPHILKLVVIAGDPIEQHPPTPSCMLLYAGIAMLIPESWLLRPLLKLVGFGPGGPIKKSHASSAQSLFLGGQVKKGSWFYILQRAGMKGIPFVYARLIMGAIGAALGAILPYPPLRSFFPGLAFRN